MKFRVLEDCYSLKEVNKLNKIIKKSILKDKEIKDFPALAAKKTSKVEFVSWGNLKEVLWKFNEFAFVTNEHLFGYDLHFLTLNKICHYNTYDTSTEYSWHIDADNQYAYDMKLTCLLNLSDKPYSGGELCLFEAGEHPIPGFNKPGSAIIFPSFIPHCVKPVTQGVRKTLTLWLNGPKFR